MLIPLTFRTAFHVLGSYPDQANSAYKYLDLVPVKNVYPVGPYCKAVVAFFAAILCFSDPSKPRTGFRKKVTNYSTRNIVQFPRRHGSLLVTRRLWPLESVTARWRML